jgi:hypothetical protein
MNEKLSVGQIVWITADVSPYVDGKPVYKPYEIARVGKKYFYINHPNENRFEISTLKHKPYEKEKYNLYLKLEKP